MAAKKAQPAAKKAAPAKKATAPAKGDHKKMTHCETKAAHRKAQNKYVAKDPKAQADRVAKSEKKTTTKAGSSGQGGGKGGGNAKGSKQGKQGHTMGRPRKSC
jgi:hypothetical protein